MLYQYAYIKCNSAYVISKMKAILKQTNIIYIIQFITLI